MSVRHPVHVVQHPPEWSAIEVELDFDEHTMRFILKREGVLFASCAKADQLNKWALGHGAQFVHWTGRAWAESERA